MEILSFRNKVVKGLFIILLLAVKVGFLFAQRTSEKNLTVLSNTISTIDQFNTNNLVSLSALPNSYNDIDVLTNINTGIVQVDVENNISGLRTVTVEYVVNKNGNNVHNFRIYNLTIVPSIVKAVDDVVRWNGNGTLVIDVKANDEFSGTANIFINSFSSSATVTIVDGKINYSQPNFETVDYIHYTLTDAIGTKDQAIVKIEPEFEYNEDKSFSFVINYNGKKKISLPIGFNVDSDPFNGDLNQIDSEHFEYVPNDYFIGLDSFAFINNNGIKVTYNAKIIDAQKDPGLVKNDKFYTPVNTPITFNVLENDLSPYLQIDTFSQTLTHNGNGSFTMGGSSAGLKNFFYTVNTPAGDETGKIKVNVGNFVPDRDINYSIDMLGNTTFIIEYDVPINGYIFTIHTPANQGTVDIYQDSTANYNCGKAYGRVIVTYTPDNGFVGEDYFALNYCINGSQCKVIEVRPNVVANPNNDCNCFNNCVWSGDLDGDGRVSASDLLVLGRYMGAVGTPRNIGSQPIWMGSEAQEWGVKTTKGRDLMHADANGDGVLTDADAQAISDNYGKINSLVPKETLGIKNIPFSVVAIPEVVDSGEVQDIYFILGSEEKPANGVHGISFVVNLGDIDSSSLVVDLMKDSWLTSDAPSMGIYKQVSSGIVHVGLTRAEGEGIIGDDADGFKVGGASGNGVIAKMTIIGDDADGFRDKNSKIIKRLIQISNISIENSEGDVEIIPDYEIEFSKKKLQSDQEFKLLVFPNPTSSVLNIVAEKIISVEVTNALGNIVEVFDGSLQNDFSLDVSKYNSGIYQVKIKTVNGVRTEKVNIFNLR